MNAASPSPVPRHVAVIMDGNGRWAKARGLPRTAGHKKGADALRRLLKSCQEHQVRYLTVYAFSSENWKRPQDEINDLMQLLKHYLKHEVPELIKNNIRLTFIGDLSRLSDDIRAQMDEATKATAHLEGFTLAIALSYGGRQEITHAARSIARMVKDGSISPEAIDETLIERLLYTRNLPEPDLLIRTGGEQRISNFLLWQSAYTEFYFTPALWPDFDHNHFTQALEDYAKRERRYGTAG